MKRYALLILSVLSVLFPSALVRALSEKEVRSHIVKQSSVAANIAGKTVSRPNLKLDATKGLLGTVTESAESNPQWIKRSLYTAANCQGPLVAQAGSVYYQSAQVCNAMTDSEVPKVDYYYHFSCNPAATGSDYSLETILKEYADSTCTKPFANDPQYLKLHCYNFPTPPDSSPMGAASIDNSCTLDLPTMNGVVSYTFADLPSCKQFSTGDQGPYIIQPLYALGTCIPFTESSTSWKVVSCDTTTNSVNSYFYNDTSCSSGQSSLTPINLDVDACNEAGRPTFQFLKCLQ